MSFIELLTFIGTILMVAELGILIVILLDGKKMLTHEATIAHFEEKVYDLYVKYFEKREMEREARNEARRKQRAAKRDEQA